MHSKNYSYGVCGLCAQDRPRGMKEHEPFEVAEFSPKSSLTMTWIWMEKGLDYGVGFRVTNTNNTNNCNKFFSMSFLLVS